MGQGQSISGSPRGAGRGVGPAGGSPGPVGNDSAYYSRGFGDENEEELKITFGEGGVGENNEFGLMGRFVIMINKCCLNLILCELMLNLMKYPSLRIVT